MAKRKGSDGLDPDNIGSWLPYEQSIVNVDLRQMLMETTAAEAEVSRLSLQSNTRQTTLRSLPLRPFRPASKVLFSMPSTKSVQPCMEDARSTLHSSNKVGRYFTLSM